MPSVGVQLSRVCPVCVPAPPGAFLPVQVLYQYRYWLVVRFVCVPLCVRVSRVSRVFVCVPAPPGVFLPVLSSVWSVCLFVRPRVPSVCPVRVSRLPPVSLYRYCTGCVSLCPGLPTVSYRVRVRYSAVYFLLMSKTEHRGSRDTHGTVPVHPPVSFTGTVHQPGTGTGNSPISHATRHSRERGDGGPHVYQATCCDPATMPTRTSHADQVLLAHGPKCATVRAVEDAQRDIWFTQFKQRNPSPGQLLVCSWQVRRAMGSGSAPRG
jgi:hypothetical protein